MKLIIVMCICKFDIIVDMPVHHGVPLILFNQLWRYS